VDVSGLSSGAVAVAAGYGHTCALTGAGAVTCWGDNGAGQLGDGTTTANYLPADVTGLTEGVVAITVSGYHSCALATGGAVKCWPGFPILTPFEVDGLEGGVIAVAAGTQHTCAITTGGGVECWGWNLVGELGDGSSTPNTSLPVDVSGLASGVTEISAGLKHTCVVSDGGVKCWGYNAYGQLGNDTKTNSPVPVDVSDLANGITSISLGYYHTCALTRDGGVKCWGSNYWGQLGFGEFNRRIPVDVRGLVGDAVGLAAGGEHTCALANDGSVTCWGNNTSGQLGDGTTTMSRIPVNVDFSAASR
jgi:alpha-tubulin suppressor-like RCC1 family protein